MGVGASMGAGMGAGASMGAGAGADAAFWSAITTDSDRTNDLDVAADGTTDDEEEKKALVEPRQVQVPLVKVSRRRNAANVCYVYQRWYAVKFER